MPEAGPGAPAPGEPPQLALGIDYGERRIGIAVGDTLTQSARPVGVDESGVPAVFADQCRCVGDAERDRGAGRERRQCRAQQREPGDHADDRAAGRATGSPPAQPAVSRARMAAVRAWLTTRCR